MRSDADKDILAPPQSRKKFSRADVRFAANQLPPDINPWSTENANYIEGAILAVAPKLRGSGKLGALIANLQEGMSRAILGGIRPNVDNSAHFTECRKFINVIATNPGGTEAAEIVGLSMEAIGINPSIVEAEIADKKRNVEEARKQREQAAEVASALAAKKTKPITNWYSGPRGDFSNLANADYLRILSFIKRRGALASGSLAQMIEAGIVYSAASDEGEYGGSTASRSTEYASAAPISYTGHSYMDYGKTWQAAVEQEIQRQEWRQEFQQEQQSWPTGEPTDVPPKVTGPADQADRIELARRQREETEQREREVGQAVAEARGGVYDPVKKTVLIPGEDGGEFRIADGQTVRVKTPAQLAQELKDKEYLANLGVTQGFVVNPDGRTVTREDGSVLRLNPGRQMTEIVSPAEAAKAKMSRRATIASAIPGQKEQSIAARLGIPRSQVTPEQIRQETHFRGQPLPTEVVAAARDEVQQDKAIIARQKLIDERNALVVQTLAPKVETPQQIAVDEMGQTIALPSEPPKTWRQTIIDTTKGFFGRTKAVERLESVPEPLLTDANRLIAEPANRENNRGLALLAAGGVRRTVNGAHYWLSPTGWKDYITGRQKTDDEIRQEQAAFHDWSKRAYDWGAYIIGTDKPGIVPKAIAEHQATLGGVVKPDGAPSLESQLPFERVEPEVKPVVQPGAQPVAAADKPSLWQQAKALVGLGETPEQKVARERLEQEAAAAKAKAATEPGFFGRLFESAEAKLAREQKAAAAEIERQMAANRAAHPTAHEPPKELPAALQPPKSGDAVPVALVPVDPAKKVLTAAVPEAGEQPGDQLGAPRTVIPGSSARFRGLAPPKASFPTNMSRRPTLGAIQQHGEPIAGDVAKGPVANDKDTTPAVAVVDPPKDKPPQVTAAEPPKDKPPEPVAAADPPKDEKKDEKKVEVAAAAPADKPKIKAAVLA